MERIVTETEQMEQKTLNLPSSFMPSGRIFLNIFDQFISSRMGVLIVSIVDELIEMPVPSEQNRSP